MQRMIPATMICLFALGSAPAEAHRPGSGIDARQQTQSTRIDAGRARGDLTRCEARRLEARGDALARRESVFRQGDGLQPGERARLQAGLDRISRDIHEQRRDGDGCR